MVNQLILKIQQIPQLLLGFIVILAVLLITVYRDPPTTLCDVQMKNVRKQLVKGFYKSDDRGKFKTGIGDSYNKCIETNSPGGCFDVFKRFDFFEEQVRTTPTECGQHPSANFVKNSLMKGLKLLAMIGWGEKPPINKYNKAAWLDTSDLGLFCRMKRQMIRLYGKNTWKAFAWSTIAGLPESKTLPRKDQWGKSLFSFPCKGLY